MNTSDFGVKSMKILMINVVCGIRSTGRICTDLAEELEKQGHEVKIAYGRENVPEKFKKYAVRVGNNFDVYLHALKARIFDTSGFESKRVTKRFVKWIKQYDPDVIHLHNIHGYYINIEILFDYLRECGKKIIWTLHDSWAFTGHTPYCDSIGCEKWISGCSSCELKNCYPKSIKDNSKINWKKKKDVLTGIPNMLIVTPSKWLQTCVKKSFLSCYKNIVINNGIDIKKFEPTQSDFRVKYNLENKYVLLGVATAWDDMKGYSDFIKLSELLDEKYKIVLVGLNKKQIKRLPNSIIGIERTTNIKELAEIYTASDLFLNLSYCENYPTVNMEAIACGTPVLTYNTGGSPESAGNIEKNICKKGDLVILISKIKDMCNNRVIINRNVNDYNTMLIEYSKEYFI